MLDDLLTKVRENFVKIINEYESPAQKFEENPSKMSFSSRKD